MASTLDFTQAPAAILLQQINYDNNSSITQAVIAFGVPSANATGAARNTSVTISAVQGSNFTGTVDWQYNRIDISIVPGVRSTLIQMPAGAVNISDLIPNINAAYGINLSAADIVDGLLPVFTGLPNEEHPFTLVMAADSLVYNNQVTLAVFEDGTAYSEVVTSAGNSVVTNDGDFVIALNPAFVSS
jgi:hypothetical protein